MTEEKNTEEQKTDEQPDFNQHFIQLVIGLQSTAWITLGKVQNPRTGKQEVDLAMARDSIDTLLMLKDKTKGNLTETEKGMLENSMHDLEMNFIEVSKVEGNKPKEPVADKEENKETKE